MVINWTNSAIQDLKNFKNITKSVNANEYVSNLVITVDMLKEHPYLGKIYLYIKNSIVRQFIYKQHKVFYFIDNEIIHIIAVIHYREDITTRINFIKRNFRK